MRISKEDIRQALENLPRDISKDYIFEVNHKRFLYKRIEWKKILITKWQNEIYCYVMALLDSYRFPEKVGKRMDWFKEKWENDSVIKNVVKWKTIEPILIY